MHMFYQRTIQLVQGVCRTTPYVNEPPRQRLNEIHVYCKLSYYPPQAHGNRWEGHRTAWQVRRTLTWTC